VALRGSGPDKTILRYGDGANIISLGRTYLSASQVALVPILSGSTKGSQQIVLQSAAGISTGTYLTITQTNPMDADGHPLVETSGYGGCSYCGHDMPSRAMAQIDRVTAVSGNTITLERPLYFDYTSSPQAYKLTMVENAGLENLRLQPTASSGTGVVYKNINLESCAHCWVHGVESDMAVDRSNVYLSDVYGSEISNDYLDDGYTHTSGETYAIFVEFRGSENRIENNIIRKARHSMIMSGGSGNVFAYNYALDPFMSEYPNALPESDTHSAHPFMNLWEGNVIPNIHLDFTHGSNSHNTIYRNYVSLASTNPQTGAPMTSGLFAAAFAYYSNYENVLGNVLGPYGSPCSATAYEIDADQGQSATIYKLGYYDDGATSAPSSALAAKASHTLLRGGNWDCVTNSVVWADGVPGGLGAEPYLARQNLPDSLYLSAKPGWFSQSSAVWPPIDPSAPAKVSKIPAQRCYENGPKVGLPFNPASCYGP
jgi:hypothetical protein